MLREVLIHTWFVADGQYLEDVDEVYCLPSPSDSIIM